MADDPTRWIEKELVRTARQVVRGGASGGRTRRRGTKGKRPPVTPLSLIMLVVLLGVAVGAFALDYQAQHQGVTEGGLQRATVEKVVDGDTLKVSVDGKEERVRLIGVDTPESVAPQAERNTEEGKEASAHTKSLVSVGQTVYLQTDREDTDKYGRLLRYVWLEEPDDARDPDEVATKMLNGKLVSDGYAKAKEYKPNTAYGDTLGDLMDEAESQGRGLWAEGDWEQAA